LLPVFDATVITPVLLPSSVVSSSSYGYSESREFFFLSYSTVFVLIIFCVVGSLKKKTQTLKKNTRAAESWASLNIFLNIGYKKVFTFISLIHLWVLSQTDFAK
jgi:hypothetical protein